MTSSLWLSFIRLFCQNIAIQQAIGKPRLDINLTTFENSYKTYDSYLDMVGDYDKIMTTYYDLRDSGRKSESFSSQILKKQGRIIKNRNKMFDTLKEQGFILNPENS